MMLWKIVGSTMTLLGAGLVVCPPASAANPYTAREVCGSAFTTTLGSFAHSYGLVTKVLKNPDNQRICAVTLKTEDIGTPTNIGAAIGPYHTDYIEAYDHGAYKYYAGPVKSYRACVWVGGLGGPLGNVFEPGSGWVVRYPFPSSCD